MKSVKRGAEQAGSAAWTWVTQWQRSRRALVAANEAVAHRARAGRPLHLYCSALLHRATRQTFVAAHDRRRLRVRASEPWLS